MTIKTTFPLILVLLAWTGLAHSAHGIVEEGYELEFDAVTLPVNAAGHVRFKQCDHCANTTLDVDENTTYHNGVRTPAISLSDLRLAAVAQDARLIYVYYDPATEIVTRVVLSTLSLD
jgi:hypothetical protein